MYGAAPAGSETETLALAVRELATEVRNLRHRVALLDGGEGVT